MGSYAGAAGSAWHDRSSNSDSWRERAALRLGHHANTILMVAIVAVIAVGLRPPPGIFMLLAPLVLIVVVLLAWSLMRQHDRRLCEACVRSMPLNAAEQAGRYQRRYWLAHAGSEPRYLIPYMTVLIGSNFATSTAGRIGWAVIQTSMVYLILATTTHRRFQPWCPWCSGGGGGQHVDDETPVLPQDDRSPV